MKNNASFINLFLFFTISLMIGCREDCETFKIGDEHEGGIIFSVDGCDGKVCSLYDLTFGSSQTNKMSWYQANLKCSNYENDQYSDWYLPSPEELLEIHESLGKEVDFSSGFYWSSEDNSTFIFPNSRVCFSLEAGFESQNHKDTLYYVRGVRQF